MRLGQARQCRQVHDTDTGSEEVTAAARRIQVRVVATLILFKYLRESSMRAVVCSCALKCHSPCVSSPSQGRRQNFMEDSVDLTARTRKIIMSIQNHIYRDNSLFSNMNVIVAAQAVNVRTCCLVPVLKMFFCIAIAPSQ
jgi:hypothetical protein